MQRVALLAQQGVRGAARVGVQWRNLVDDLPSDAIQILVIRGQGRVFHDLELVNVVIIRAVHHHLLDATAQVVVVPPGLNDQHTAAGCKAGVGRGQIPLPHLLAPIG